MAGEAGAASFARAVVSLRALGIEPLSVLHALQFGLAPSTAQAIQKHYGLSPPQLIHFFEFARATVYSTQFHPVEALRAHDFISRRSTETAKKLIITPETRRFQP